MPILLGIEKSERFLTRWEKETLSLDEASHLSTWLREDGIEDLVQAEFNTWNKKALTSLKILSCEEKVKNALEDFANKLLMRKK